MLTLHFSVVSPLPPSTPLFLSQAWVPCSIGLISGMLLLLPLFVLALIATSSSSPCSSPDQSTCCRFPLEPPMALPLNKCPPQSLERKVTKERLLLRWCFSKMVYGVWCSSPLLSSSIQSWSTQRNSWTTSWTSGSTCFTCFLNLTWEDIYF